MSKNHQLVAIATRVGLGQISTTPLDCPTPKTPTLVQTSCFYLYRCQSYSRLKLPAVMQIFIFWGRKGGKCKNSSSRSPKGTSLRESASFDV